MIVTSDLINLLCTSNDSDFWAQINANSYPVILTFDLLWKVSPIFSFKHIYQTRSFLKWAQRVNIVVVHMTNNVDHIKKIRKHVRTYHPGIYILYVLQFIGFCSCNCIS